MAGAAVAAMLLSLMIYDAENAKDFRASHERLIWSFDVLANDRASADMRAADKAAKAHDDRFIEKQIDLWLDHELHRYRI